MNLYNRVITEVLNYLLIIVKYLQVVRFHILDKLYYIIGFKVREHSKSELRFMIYTSLEILIIKQQE